MQLWHSKEHGHGGENSCVTSSVKVKGTVNVKIHLHMLIYFPSQDVQALMISGVQTCRWMMDGAASYSFATSGDHGSTV